MIVIQWCHFVNLWSNTTYKIKETRKKNFKACFKKIYPVLINAMSNMVCSNCSFMLNRRFCVSPFFVWNFLQPVLFCLTSRYVECCLPPPISMAEHSAVSEAVSVIACSKQPLLIIGKGSMLWCRSGLYKFGTRTAAKVISFPHKC